MSTKTKCTLTLCCLFLVEILPLPFTAMLSLFAVRKRPRWVLNVVNRLYEGEPSAAGPWSEDDAAGTRARCTTTLVIMTLIDLGPIPVTIPVALYVVRRRPNWFRTVIDRLYADESSIRPLEAPNTDRARDGSELPEFLRERYQELERRNRDFALATGRGSNPVARDMIGRGAPSGSERSA